MRINWMSNAPWANTGYGNQTRVFVPRLRALGHQIICTAFYGLEGAILNWDGVPVYPKGRDTYGNDVGAAHTASYGARVIITLIDAWVMQPDMLQLHGVRWVPWFPVDMEPIPPPVAKHIKKAYRRVVFSRFAERMVHDAGLDCSYVPHGIDTDVYKPITDETQAEIREKLRLPGDKFIVGTVAANKGTPSRKALPEMLEAFALFHQKHPDTAFYIHTYKGENGEFQGVNLPEACAAFGLEVGTDVLFPDQYQMLIGFADPYINALYNAFDVFLLPSMGEGFGIPIVEAQAAGCPVIISSWTSMEELCFAGWQIPRRYSHIEGYPPIEEGGYYTPLASKQFKPDIGPIVEALEQAYSGARSAELKKRAVKGARLYDADRVVRKYWRPFLAELDEAVGEWQR